MSGLFEGVKSSVPVVLSLAITWFLTYIISGGPPPPAPAITPIPEPAGDSGQALYAPAPYLNTLIVLTTLVAGGVIMVYLLHHHRALKVFAASLTAAASFSVTSYFLLLASPLDGLFVFTISGLAALAVLYSIFKRGGVPSVLASAYVGASAGSVMGISIPYWTAIIVLIGVSAYDIVAVSIGPLKVLGSDKVGRIPGLMVDFGGISLGMGDLFFYSVAQSFSIYHWGPQAGLMSTTGLVIGFLTTVYLAGKRRIIAGLPLPLTLSLALGYLAGSLLQ
ncbi:hypothetical protein HRbin01_01182 [archaeon HR01]|nr:hypothetical protein HRbin01_01182 [archaeon HR01]